MSLHEPILIDIIAGARPNFMKVAPIIKALQAREAAGGPLRYRLVHTGNTTTPGSRGLFLSSWASRSRM